MGLTYYRAVRRENATYSCDMIRLLFKTIYKDSEGRFVHMPVDTLSSIMDLNGWKEESYTSNRISTYHYMHIYRKGESVITLGIEHNHMTDNVYNNFLEFNPNKADMSAILFIMRFIMKWAKFSHATGHYFEVGRYDIAVDIPTERRFVRLLKQGRREYKYVHGADGSVTEYLGKRNTNGFVKLYDKTKESGLDCDMTRIEITVDDEGLNLPDVYLREYQYDMFDTAGLNDTDRVLVEMLKRLDSEEQRYWFKQLGRRKQESLKKYVFSEENMFRFDRSAISEVMDIVDDIRHMKITEGGDFIDSHIKWFNKYREQFTTFDNQRDAYWSTVDEETVRRLFESEEIRWETWET